MFSAWSLTLSVSLSQSVSAGYPRRYLYEVLGPCREDLSGQWSVWCSRLLNLP